jgi:hypothetical protein
MTSIEPRQAVLLGVVRACSRPSGKRGMRISASAAMVAALLVLAACGGGGNSASQGSRNGETEMGPATPVSFPSDVPADTPVTKLLVFVMENHSLAQMSAGMPATYDVAKRFGYAENYQALTHPSLPNYIAIVSGDLHGVVDDRAPSAWPLEGPTVFGAALEADRTAAVYAEDMPGTCHPYDSGDYAVRHNPWTYFVDERDLCAQFDVPLGSFEAAVHSGRLPNAGMVVPNLCNDAHDCSLTIADRWFASELQKVVTGPDWRSGHLAVVLTADEDDRRSDNKVLTVVIHPSQRHHVVSQPLDHYALHQLYLDVLGIPDGSGADSMADAFGLPLRR